MMATTGNTHQAHPSTNTNDKTLSKIKPQPNHPPNATLYLSNIDWSIKKPLLKRALLSLFTRHGKVLEVIVLRGDSSSQRPLRGQSWVIFDSVSSATTALGTEQGFLFFGRPLVINYAKDVSDRVAKRNGSFKKKGKRRANTEELEGGGASKLIKVEDGSTPGPVESNAPSSTLIARNVPEDCNELMLVMLFKQHPGFQGVTAVKEGEYKIEYDSEREATAALKGLNGFKLNTSTALNLTYGQ